MSENIFRFRNRRQMEAELHEELVTSLDRCLELTMMLEKSDIKINYKRAGDSIYDAFILVEDFTEEA